MFNNPTNPDEQNTQVQKYYGKYPGRVVNNKQTAEGAGLGELTVEVPGILEETANGQDSQPIKVLAKPCFFPGFFFVPDKDAPVWVEFAAGDINQPIWTGVWYPKDGLPKTAADDTPDETQKVIRTTSGHVTQMIDTDKKEEITIHHKSGATIQMDKDGSVLIANANGSFAFFNAKDKQLTLGEEHGNLLTMTENGVVIANQGSKVTLEMKGSNLTITSDKKVNIVAGTVSLQSNTINLGGGMGTPEPVILGTTFLLKYATHTHATALGPSGPPLPPPDPTVLSKGVIMWP